eukprot:856536_1
MLIILISFIALIEFSTGAHRCSSSKCSGTCGDDCMGDGPVLWYGDQDLCDGDCNCYFSAGSYKCRGHKGGWYDPSRPDGVSIDQNPEDFPNFDELYGAKVEVNHMVNPEAYNEVEGDYHGSGEYTFSNLQMFSLGVIICVFTSSFVFAACYCLDQIYAPNKRYRSYNNVANDEEEEPINVSDQ